MVTITLPDDGDSQVDVNLPRAVGSQGIQGPAGPGVAAGGLMGQVLTKSTDADYDTVWMTGGGGGGGVMPPFPISYTTGLQTALDGKQPLDGNLTSIAALTTTSNGRGFLTLTDAAAGRTYLGLGTAALSASTDFAPADPDLASFAAISATSVLAYRASANTWSGLTLGMGLGLIGTALTTFDAMGFCNTMDVLTIGGVSAISGVNRAHYMRLRGGKTGATVVRIGVGAASGNISVGIYPNNGQQGRNALPAGPAKVVVGSTAMSTLLQDDGSPIGANTSVLIPLGATVNVDPGDWVAVALDNTSATLSRAANPTNASMLKGILGAQTTAFPAPTTPGTVFQSTPHFYVGVE